MHDLFKLIRDGEIEELRRVVSKLTPAELSRPDENGDTPLHVAVSINEPDAVALLVRGGARADVKDAEGLTPLNAALAEESSQEIVKLLQSSGNDDSDIVTAANMLSSRRLASALSLNPEAAKNEPADLVELAVAAAIKKAWSVAGIGHRRDPEKGELIFQEASEFVRTLVKAGAPVDGKNPSRTPLFLALQEPSSTLAATLLGLGADPSWVGKHGARARDYAKNSPNRTEMMSLLKMHSDGR